MIQLLRFCINISKEYNSGYYRDTHTIVFAARLVTIVNSWDLSGCAPSNEWTKKSLMCLCIRHKSLISYMIYRKKYGIGDNHFLWNKSISQRQIVFFVSLVEVRSDLKLKVKVVKMEKGREIEVRELIQRKNNRNQGQWLKFMILSLRK